jgi:hypothetical protein
MIRKSLEEWRVWADEEQLQGQVAIMKVMKYDVMMICDAM